MTLTSPHADDGPACEPALGADEAIVDAYLRTIARSRPGRTVRRGTLVAVAVEPDRDRWTDDELATERAFLRVAAQFSRRRRLSARAWLEFGVPASTIALAGIE